MLGLAMLKGMVQGFLVTAPAILVLKLVGDEGILGVIQGISGALTALLVYILGRVAHPEDRIKIFVSGLVLFFIGTLCNGILYSALGVILFVLELIFVANNINDEMKALKLYEQDGIVYIDKGNLTITKDVVGYYNSESNVYYVEGYLHNNSNRSYKSITISYTIYDAKGNVLGESNAFLSNLEKGKTWNFKSVYDDIDSKDALRFEIREVTYFAGM